jgi:dihydroorotate dehydrogenase electron transfer subunit
MRQLKATVIAKNEPIQGIDHLQGKNISFSQVIYFDCPGIEIAKPGQFIMVRCGDNFLSRPFSIHQISAKGEVALYFAVLENGKGTRWLAERKVGEALTVLGPLGNGFQVMAQSPNLLLAAGGMGIAPLLFLAEDAQRKGLSVTLLYGAAWVNPYVEEACHTRGIKLLEVTEDGSAGHRGLVTDLIREYIGRADQVFACGPPPMYRAMAEMPELVHKPVQVSLEVRMACGIGACLGCTIRTKAGLKQVCKDGPVFNLNDIVWEEVKC